MVTPEQRRFLYEQVRAFLAAKPIFTMDFWNDGEYAGGCVAGGRRYLHINANGDIEPCAFIHYSDSNIRDKTILEALQSPLFRAYHAGQPFNDNPLRPCPLLDNPRALQSMVHATGRTPRTWRARRTSTRSPESASARRKTGRRRRTLSGPAPASAPPARRAPDPLCGPGLRLDSSGIWKRIGNGHWTFSAARPTMGRKGGFIP